VSIISTYWSDAKYWAGNAAADGYTVDHNATVGSIMQYIDQQYIGFGD
jgi:surface antigen